MTIFVFCRNSEIFIFQNHITISIKAKMTEVSLIGIYEFKQNSKMSMVSLIEKCLAQK